VNLTGTGPERRALSGSPLQRCFASRCAGRTCGAPLTLETSVQLGWLRIAQDVPRLTGGM
jgi:hypothetical protein